MKVLSLHSMGHDTAAAWFEDGRLVHAVETERLTRWKHDHRVRLALRHLFAQDGVRAEEADLITVSSPVRDSVLRLADPGPACRAVRDGTPYHRTTSWLLGRPVDCVVVTHEVSHAALALHYAGYPDDCVVLVNEGRGQVARSSVFRCADGDVDWVETDPLPWYGNGFGWSALGWLYGFGKSPSVAGKVMAIGGYGTPDEHVRGLLEDVDPRVLDDRARAEEEGRRLARLPEFSREFDAMARVVATFQQMFTDSVHTLLAKHVEDPARTALALGGGCALNIVANSALRDRFGHDIAIPPACGDAGHALGAAVFAHHVLYGQRVRPFSVYCNGGAEPAADVHATLIAAGLDPLPYEPGAAARTLADGGVVAFAHGPSESGPRALGNRSLLGNPETDGMRRRLSQHLKRREWFRPLGAVMRAERFADWFPGQLPSPHMLFNYDVPAGRIPQARHADGTCRMQTVTREQNAPLHRLLDEFERLSGVPALINTSLNAQGRAIAHTAHDALMDFAHTDVDLYVLGDLMARRRTE
ncbi:carbamoyltransferase C-terminal domain-containing protein [Streptomyces sp. NPDC057654]|uniref:carbamoyltransferase C-terminal domain-containing protein n=1 Tax=Streptomyces sp. NPDC057654 TaxID=3346196 RepID=UPI00367D4B40